MKSLCAICENGKCEKCNSIDPEVTIKQKVGVIYCNKFKQTEMKEPVKIVDNRKCDNCINNYKLNGCKTRKQNFGIKVCTAYLATADHIENNESVELTKTMRHMQVCKELNSLYEAKNHDYGDSFAKVRNELGNVAILVRLYDKIERLKTLLTGADVKVKDESIEDSFKDLINYGIMELVERAVDKDGNK